ncbi:MAG: hypothetical protein AAGD96_16760 [Chloroflexota bacterium]
MPCWLGAAKTAVMVGQSANDLVTFALYPTIIDNKPKRHPNSSYRLDL